MLQSLFCIAGFAGQAVVNQTSLANPLKPSQSALFGQIGCLNMKHYDPSLNLIKKYFHFDKQKPQNCPFKTIF